jgi:sodium transport system permease protein
MNPALTVFLKELKDSLRDRRTLLMVLVASVATGPLALALMAGFLSGLEEKAATRKVLMAHAEHAPALVNFFERNDVQIETAPEDYEAQVKDGRIDAVIAVSSDFNERYLSGAAAYVDLVYDDSRTDATPAVRQAERLLQAFNRETGVLRLIARGVSPDLAEPVKVEHVNAATPRQKAAFLLFLIPMFAVLSPLLGGMTVAIDATAGERERGSLEPLLMNPVTRQALVIGKWLTAWTYGSGVAMLTLGGFALTAHFYAQRKIAALMQFGPPELLPFALIVIPFAAFTASLQMLISTYGRSYREAQTYVSYLATATSFVPIVVMLTSPREAFWHLFVPVFGQQMALGRVIKGDALGAADFLLPGGVALLGTALCLATVSRLLREERIVFGRNA